jgi:hypothetical protein
MNEGVRITYRKNRRQDIASYYAVVTRDGRPIWSCPDDHPSRRRALSCGRRWVRLGAGVPLPAPKPGSRRGVHHAPSIVVGSTGKPEIRRSLMERLIACAVSESDQGENTSYGIYVHDCIYEYLLSCVQHNQESRWTDLERIVVNQFYRVPRGLGPQFLDEARALLDQFAHTHLADLHTLLWVDGKPALEHTLRTDIGWAVVHATADRLDRIDGDDPDDPPRIIMSTDYKTQWAATPHLFQGRTQAQLAFIVFPDLEEFHWMPDPFKLRTLPQDGTIVYRRGDLDEWWKETLNGVKVRWDLRLSGRAVPTGGSACQYCALRYTCPQALPVARGIPENREQFEELFGEWVRLDEAAKIRKAGLAVWAKDRAPIRIGGYEVGWLVPLEDQWKASDPMGIVSHLDAAGLDGKSALVTWIAPDKVPYDQKPALVAAGVARYERGPASFKRRKAGAGPAGDEE